MDQDSISIIDRFPLLLDPLWRDATYCILSLNETIKNLLVTGPGAIWTAADPTRDSEQEERMAKSCHFLQSAKMFFMVLISEL